MSNGTSGVYMVLSTVVGALDLVVLVCGLVVSLRYRYLSTWMMLISAGLLGMCATSGLNLTLRFSQGLLGMGGGDVVFAIYSLSSLVWLAALTSLVIGLTLVFKDIRERFQRLRELHEERGPGASGAAP